MRIAVLGISGMFGSMAFRLLTRRSEFEVFGSLRSATSAALLGYASSDRVLTGIDARDPDGLVQLLSQARPAIVINAIGIVKQLAAANDPLITIPINAELPHRLARVCALLGARLIHISTDCVFSGRTGGYLESDPPDVADVYGLSKFLGEVDYPNAVTLRTSIIGPELGSRNGLLEWFLAQRGQVPGYTGAVFSGLTSAELTSVIADYVIPRPELHGLYHVAAEPIAKYDLLRAIAAEYNHPVELERDSSVVIDRSLNGDRFRSVTGYVAPSWPEMIRRMRELDLHIERRSK